MPYICFPMDNKERNSVSSAGCGCDLDKITIAPPVEVVAWCGAAGRGYLRLLDQTLLPNEIDYVECHDRHTVRSAIRKLVVRGAPAIGVAGGYGMVVAAQNIQEGDDFLSRLAAVAEYLEGARPTAVNLSWAVRRIEQRAITEANSGANDSELIVAMLDEARAIHTEDVEMCMSIGRNAAGLVIQHSGLLTHCNAGALATVGIGTATAGMYVAHKAGHEFTVYCDETRPLLQGSRLTAWELQKAGINAVVITDSMSAHTMKTGRVGMVIVGADRIAANGDAANKIGTYGIAILAKHHGIPFYVAAPYSTFDLTLECGDEIPIEQRGGDEVTEGFGRRTAPEGIATFCPAFDVTPAELITGIITDRGIIDPVTTANVKKIIG